MSAVKQVLMHFIEGCNLEHVLLWLQGIVNRSVTPVNNRSASPSYNRGFGQAGLAASQGYAQQVFQSPLGSKGLTPPGLVGRVGSGPNASGGLASPAMSQLGAAGLANHLPRTAGLLANSQFKSSSIFNMPPNQPPTSRFQAMQGQMGQMGQGAGLQQYPNGLGNFGDGRNLSSGPPGLGLGQQQPLGNNGVLDFAQLKQLNQRQQIMQELQKHNQQTMLRQQQAKPQHFSQQQANQTAQAQLMLERREQVRQLMQQQSLLDLTPQQLQQLQAQQMLLNQQKGLQQQQNLWPNRNGSPGLQQTGLGNPNAGHRLFQR